MIEEFVVGLEASIEDAKKKIYGVVTGRVIDLADPMMLGRVRVQIQTIDAMDLSPWARLAGPMAGFFSGYYFVPNIGDEVLVAFENGDTAVPYIVGSLWTAVAPPPQQSPLPQIRAIRTLGGNQLVFTELPPTVTLQTGPTAPQPMPTPGSPVGPHTTVMLAPDGVSITSPASVRVMVGTNLLTVTPDGIMLQAGSSVIKLTTAGIDIAAPRIGVTGAGTVAVSGALVRINS